MLESIGNRYSDWRKKLMDRKMALVLVLGLGLLLFGTFPEVSMGESEAKGCLKCHQGIESIGVDHEDLACEDCHHRRGSSRRAV